MSCVTPPHLRLDVFPELRLTHETNLISNHVNEFIKASFSTNVTILLLNSPVPLPNNQLPVERNTFVPLPTKIYTALENYLRVFLIYGIFLQRI